MIVIGARYCGPPTSGNGGYSAGVIAAQLGLPAAERGPIEVTLRTPPPLDVELTAHRDGPRVEVRHGDVVVGEARPGSVDLDAGEPVSLDAAIEASERYPWFHDNPYPTCFVCGPDRAEGDGLRIFPGAVDGRDVAAAPWHVHESVGEGGFVRPEVMWGALDCPSWFGYAAFDEWTGRPLLGRLTADIRSLPRVGETCVVGGWTLGREGRKIDSAAVVWGEDGRVHGISRARWILVDQPAD